MSVFKAIKPPPKESILAKDEDGKFTGGIGENWLIWFFSLTSKVPVEKTYVATVNLANVPANSEIDDIITVFGLTKDDAITANPPDTFEAGLGIMYVTVSGVNTMTIRIRNFTGVNIDPASATWLIGTKRR